MTVHVAVLDPLPVFRRGIAAALSSVGHLVEEPADAVAWLRERPGGMVLLTLHSAEDLDRLTALCRLRPRPLVVALPSGDVSSLVAVTGLAGPGVTVVVGPTGSSAGRWLWRSYLAPPVLAGVSCQSYLAPP